MWIQQSALLKRGERAILEGRGAEAQRKRICPFSGQPSARGGQPGTRQSRKWDGKFVEVAGLTYQEHIKGKPGSCPAELGGEKRLKKGPGFVWGTRGVGNHVGRGPGGGSF